VSLFVIILVLARGFLFYKDALDKTPLSVKVSEITSNSNYVTIDNISDSMKKFIVTVEDKRFYTHSGIDITAIVSSMISNLSVGYYKYGGSTITQQLAKNMYFRMIRILRGKLLKCLLRLKLKESTLKIKFWKCI
ncbi:Glycosyl transferase family 51, partial [Candidatus Arthromitus sp. SFB-5]